MEHLGKLRCAVEVARLSLQLKAFLKLHQFRPRHSPLDVILANAGKPRLCPFQRARLERCLNLRRAPNGGAVAQRAESIEVNAPLFIADRGPRDVLRVVKERRRPAARRNVFQRSFREGFPEERRLSQVGARRRAANRLRQFTGRHQRQRLRKHLQVDAFVLQRKENVVKRRA